MLLVALPFPSMLVSKRSQTRNFKQMRKGARNSGSGNTPSPWWGPGAQPQGGSEASASERSAVRVPGVSAPGLCCLQIKHSQARPPACVRGSRPGKRRDLGGHHRVTSGLGGKWAQAAGTVGDPAGVPLQRSLTVQVTIRAPAGAGSHWPLV